MCGGKKCYRILHITFQHACTRILLVWNVYTEFYTDRGCLRAEEKALLCRRCKAGSTEADGGSRAEE